MIFNPVLSARSSINCCLFSGSNQVNFLVVDGLASFVPQKPFGFNEIGNPYDGEVSEHQLRVADLFVRKRIDNSHSNYHEQVGHFFDSERLRSVPQNTENGKETKRKPKLQLNSTQQVTQEENENIENETSEQVVFPVVYWVID